MKINLGCGRDYRPGWLNVDFFAAANPDRVVDLEATPWPFDSDCAEIILMKHVFHTLGGGSKSFRAVMAELYRVCAPGGLVEIHVPHPLHADFLGDPTHVRPILPEMFQCFDLATTERRQAAKLPGTPLAKYDGIDFETVNTEYFLDPYWANLLANGQLDQAQLALRARSDANVIQWMRITLRARKPFRHGRSLDHLGAICLERHVGLGDVVMALAAASALKAMSGKPVYLLTSNSLRAVAEACPSLDGVVTSEDEVAALHEKYKDRGGMHRADLNAALFGISGRHQIDTYLEYFGLTAEPGQKQIVLDCSVGRGDAEAYLGGLPALADGRRRILVHAAQGDPNRTWPKANWAELCDRLARQGHQVILIGHSSEVPDRGVHLLEIPGVFPAVDRLSMLSTVALMERSDLLISTDSGPVQLAGATNIHIVGLYSVVAGNNRLPFRNSEAGWGCNAIMPTCGHSPCYRWIHDADTLARTNFANPRQLFSEWCLADEKYACMTRQITVDSVCEAVTQAVAPPPHRPSRRRPATSPAGS